MNAVIITGMSGAGKTTIAAVLAHRGLASIDADDDPVLARSVDLAGNVVEDPATPDFAWLAQHSWAWNPARLDALVGNIRDDLCDGSDLKDRTDDAEQHGADAAASVGDDHAPLPYRDLGHD